MGLKPTEMLKMKGRLQVFRQEHPKIEPFFKKVSQEALMPGSILELKVTNPKGEELLTNIRLTPDDVETLRMLIDPKGKR